MAAQKYKSLKDYTASRCGTRGAVHAAARDRLVEIAVEEFPSDADPERLLEVLTARLRVRIRKEYGAIFATLLISILANLVARAVWEWWKSHRSHRVSMIGWQEESRAQED